MDLFKNKVAVVTGAGSGIGRALAKQLARHGCHLILADINQQGLEDTKTDLTGNYSQSNLKLVTQVVDVSNHASMKKLANEVGEEFQAVDLLINNAGVGLGAFFHDMTIEDMRDLFEINYWGVVYGCDAFLPLLENSKNGCIVNVSSVLGLLSGPRVSAYCGSKFAVRGFSDSLRHDFRIRSKHIKVACAFPSGIKTDILDSSKIIVNPDGASTPQIERERVRAWFWTEAETAAADILAGVKKGKTRIHVGRGSRFLDLLSRFLPVSYTRFLPKIMFE